MKTHLISAALFIVVMWLTGKGFAADPQMVQRLSTSIATGNVRGSFKSWSYTPSTKSSRAYHEALMLDSIGQEHTMRVYIDTSGKPVEVAIVTRIIVINLVSPKEDSSKEKPLRSGVEFREIHSGMDGQVISGKIVRSLKEADQATPIYLMKTDKGKAHNPWWQNTSDMLISSIARALYQ